MISLTKKLLSVALAVVLLLGAFPATVLADGATTHDVNFYASKADFEGGKAPLATVPTAHNTPVDLTKAPAAPTVAGMTATGNWIYCVHGTVYNPSNNIVDTTNLYPEYTKNPEKAKYRVSFNTNSEVPNPADTMVEENTDIVLPELKREGFTLTNWKGAGKPGAKYTVTADVTLTAEWVRNEYTVTFLKADGSVLHSETVRHDEKIAHVPSLSEAGAKDGQYAYDWDTKVDGAVKSNMTIKPLFRSADYTITFDPNFGSCETKSKNVTYGEKIGKMPVPERQDFVFQGWFRDGMEYTKNTVYNVAGNITLTAKWAPEAKVELHIYRNGKTSSAYVEPMIPDIAAGTILKMSDIDVSKYYNGSDSFKVIGIFDPMGWRAYKANENAKPIEQVQTIDPADGITELYCMVIDTNEPKPTTKPADPSNPQTGDESMILASTAAMLISAGALAAYIYDRKRRMA